MLIAEIPLNLLVIYLVRLMNDTKELIESTPNPIVSFNFRYEYFVWQFFCYAIFAKIM
jgi:hypothetical protein